MTLAAAIPNVTAAAQAQMRLSDMKPSVRLATAAALPAYTASGAGIGKRLTAAANGALTVDGVAAALDDRILVQHETLTAAKHNGPYKVIQPGSAGTPWILERSEDADEDAEVTPNIWMFAEEGVANAEKAFQLTTNAPIVADTTALTFEPFGAAGAADWTRTASVPAGFFSLVPTVASDSIASGDGQASSDRTRPRGIHRAGEPGTGMTWQANTGGKWWVNDGVNSIVAFAWSVASGYGRIRIGGDAVAHTIDAALQIGTEATRTYTLWSTRNTQTGMEVYGGSDATSPVIGSYSNHDFDFITNNTRRLRITAAGLLHLLSGGSPSAPQLPMPSDTSTGPYDFASATLAYAVSGRPAYTVSSPSPTFAVEAADTSGQDVFFAGTRSGPTPTASRSGGGIGFRGGPGNTSANSIIGGSGGAVSNTGGTGGNNTGGASGGPGGFGANNTNAGGQGGSTNSTGAHAAGDGGLGILGGGAAGDQTGAGASGAGGKGANARLAPGVGGSAIGAASTGNGGNGGNAEVLLPSGGTSVGGASGLRGRLLIDGGVIAANQEIAITPSATHSLTLRQTAVANQTSITSFMIGVNTDITGRKLLLPNEADGVGVAFLIIRNTHATNTLDVRNSGDTATIATVLGGQTVLLACNGTAWFKLSLS